MGEESVVAFFCFFPLSDFTLLVSLQILWLPFLGTSACRSPEAIPQRKQAQPARLTRLCLLHASI